MINIPTLPVDGQTNWGDPLNAYINALDTEANTTQANLNNHAANNPSDPHGDRAYAQSLVSPLTTGVNLPNGFVKLNSQGTIPPGLVTGLGGPGGIYNSIFDAVATYGAVAGTGSDQSTAIQNALNAAGSSGGGIVYIGPGIFSLANYLVIPSNTWLLMSVGTILSRIRGSVNSPYMITNVKFGTSNAPSTNIRITGGNINSYGSQSITSPCISIFIIQSIRTIIEDIYFFNPFGIGPAIEINGCSGTWITRCKFDGVLNTGTSAIPAIRINTSSTNTTPSGLNGAIYNKSNVYGCYITNSYTASFQPQPGFHGPFGSFTATDKVDQSANDNSTIVITGCSTGYPSTFAPVYIASGTSWAKSVTSGNSWEEATAIESPFNSVSVTSLQNNNGSGSVLLTDQWSVPAWDAQPGTTYEVEMDYDGQFSNQTLQFQFVIDGTPYGLATLGNGFFSSSTAFSGTIRGRIQIVTPGAGSSSSANVFLDGGIGILGTHSSGVNNNNAYLNARNTGIQFDTTLSHTLAIAAQWGGSSSGQQITSHGSRFIKITS